jgi:hypothetical protein
MANYIRRQTDRQAGMQVNPNLINIAVSAASKWEGNLYAINWKRLGEAFVTYVKFCLKIYPNGESNEESQS